MATPVKEGTTLADLLRRRRLGDFHRLVLRSAKRRSPQGGSNKPSIVRRQRVVALWSHISVHNPSHNLLAALVL